MRFSVVVPVYNVEKYIYECLESIYDQDYDDYEVILVDDGSEDKSGNICDEYAKKHANTMVIHKPNQGLISARRAGFGKAQGEYIINCDSDDYIEKDMMRSLSGIIDDCQPDMIVFNGFLKYPDHKEVFCEHIFKEGFVDKKDVYDKLLLTYTVNSLCMKTYKRDLLDIDADYADFYKYNYGEDLLQTVPIAVNAKDIYYFDRFFYNYRAQTGMMTKYSNQLYWSNKAIYENIKEQLKNESIYDFEKKISKYLVSAAYEAIRLNRVVGEYHEEDIKNIANDKDFINAYSIIKNSDYFKRLNYKQKIIIKLINKNHIFMLKILFKLF